jgi:ABC-2 type transport system ATP-binding protein
VEAKGNVLVFKTPTPQLSLSQIIQEVLQAGGKIDKVEIRAPNLESVFLDLTGRRLRD